MSNTILIFSYGSNMLTKRIQARVASVRAVGVGYVSGHVLRWHKVSTDGSGKCDVFETRLEGDAVWGVIFEISAEDKPTLDRYEGLGYGYAEKSVKVICDGTPIEAMTYYATRTDPDMVPYRWYKDFVLHGAKEHGLPQDYIAAIEAAPAKDDPDTERAAKNRAILEG